jgi:hypothetical protein
MAHILYVMESTDRRSGKLVSVSPLESNLNALRNSLRWMIDVDYNLLGMLRNMAVLNDDQIELIQSKPTTQLKLISCWILSLVCLISSRNNF